MSLINKMLQDLDARGTPGADAFPTQIRPVVQERAGLADRLGGRTAALALGGTAAACALAAVAWFGWGYYQHKHASATAAVVASAAPALKAAPPAAQGMTGTISMAPVSAHAPQPMSVPPAVPQKDAFDAPAPKTVAGYEPDSEEARAARQAIMAELKSRMAPVHAVPAAHARVPESGREARRRRLAEAREPKAARRAQAADKAGAKDKQLVAGRQESGSQRAEGEYRHALTALQDGRMTEAVAALEQTLKLEPGHDAARQTLVGLLIEARRSDEAMRQLQTALTLDARQPALAMLLARLQIEAGGTGIDTLTRTLPYAGNNADYHAFLAGALQRQQRHREAAEQYQAALRAAPGNGVWWMGLGMSLQAEKRNAEAQDAFQRARASGTLSAELQAFVERRLQQLGR